MGKQAESNLVRHTSVELEILRRQNAVSQTVCDLVLDLARILSSQGHSGSSVAAVLSLVRSGTVKDLAQFYEQDQDDVLLAEAHDQLGLDAVELLNRLKSFDLDHDQHEMVMHLFLLATQFRPLSPLTGDEDEWGLVSEHLYQNKRCSCVFSSTDLGLVENIDAVVFVEPSGVQFTAYPSRQPIRFPYTWHQEFVQLDKEDNAVDPAQQKHADALRAWRTSDDKNLVN